MDTGWLIWEGKVGTYPPLEEGYDFRVFDSVMALCYFGMPTLTEEIKDRAWNDVCQSLITAAGLDEEFPDRWKLMPKEPKYLKKWRGLGK